jgi:hypothetical protein
LLFSICVGRERPEISASRLLVAREKRRLHLRKSPFVKKAKALKGTGRFLRVLPELCVKSVKQARRVHKVRVDNRGLRAVANAKMIG